MNVHRLLPALMLALMLPGRILTACTVNVTASMSDHNSALTWGFSVDTSSCAATGRIDWEEYRDGAFVWASYCNNPPCGFPPSTAYIYCQPPGDHTIQVKVWADTFCGTPAKVYCEDTKTYTIAPKRDVSAGEPTNGHFDSYGTWVYDIPFDFSFANVWPHEADVDLIPTETTSGNGGTNFNTALWDGNITKSVAPGGSHLAEIWSYACGTYKRAGMISFPEAPKVCHICQQCPGDPVHITGGNMSYAETTPLPPIAGAPFSMMYDSKGPATGVTGAGWGTLFRTWMKTRTERDGSTLVVIGTKNDEYVFVSSGGVWAQLWPTSSQPSAFRYDGALSSYVMREPGSDVETYYRTSDGRVIKRRSVSTGREAVITYDAGGRPARVADSWGNGAWNITTNSSTGLIESIAVEGTSIVWNYSYDGNRNLLSINLGSTPWRTYTYASGRMTEARDGAGNLIESHQYDAGGAATTSIGPSGDITSISYNGVGRVPGETVTTIVSSAGATTNYYSRYVGGEQRPVQVDGICSGCGTKDGVYGYDDFGRVIREQNARGYLTLQTYDDLGRLLTRSGPYAPTGCNPDSDSNHCRLTPDSILTADLTAFAVTSTTNNVYGDLLWPDRPTAITTDSVLQPGGVRTESFAYDSVSGVALQHTITGYTGSPAAQTSLTTTTTLYDGTEGAAFNPGGSFSSAWLTLPQPSHLRKTIDGPRTDVADVASFVYYPVDNSVTATWRGQLAAMKNAAGHITHYENYDVFGNAGRVIDPNGVATEQTFDSLGRQLTATLRGVAGCDTSADPLCATDLTTSRTYLLTTGPLASLTDPNGNVTAYEYDTRGRTSAVSRGPSSADLKERIAYAYDVASGQKSEERYLAMAGGSWVEKKKETFHYDSEARLSDVTHPDQTSIAYSYNIAGNMTGARDENHTTPNTLYLYDPAGSLSTVTQTLGVTTISTTYLYDKRGNLAAVNDPNGNQTSYIYDDFGRLLSQTSAVTGTTAYVYDLAGNATSITDGNGVTTTRIYDALNRLVDGLSTSNPSHLGNSVEEELQWTYDDPTAGAFGIGRLATSMSPDSNETYAYARSGQIRLEHENIQDEAFVQTYSYDAAGNRTQIGYPSGRVLTYTLDFAGRPVTATGLFNGVTTHYVTGASYLPFGPLDTRSFGNGTVEARSFDQRYRPTGLQLTAGNTLLANYTYGSDGVGNITQIIDASNPAYSRTFGYDDLNRLITANTGSALWGSGSYTYDHMGNMLSAILGNKTRSFSYAGTTPGVNIATASGISTQIAYDAAGNELNGPDGYDSYTTDSREYSSRNLLQQIVLTSRGCLGPLQGEVCTGGYVQGNTTLYNGYDARGVRVVMTQSSSPHPSPITWPYYFYTPELIPLNRASDDGGQADLISFAGTPIADENVDSPRTRFILTDHLGTPIMETDTTGAVAWRAEYEPFGNVYTMRTGSRTDQTLRFPGQQVAFTNNAGDEESYNIFRWYRTGWGRYTQADPLSRHIEHYDALRGGVIASTHLYAYADDRPIVQSDRSGLGAEGILTIPEIGPAAATGFLAVVACLLHPECRRQVRCAAEFAGDTARCARLGLCNTTKDDPLHNARVESCLIRSWLNWRACITGWPRPYPDPWPGPNFRGPRTPAEPPDPPIPTLADPPVAASGGH